jgi:DNA-directed RNA polymerase sigma subunit (sigma70/sigma32)
VIGQRLKVTHQRARQIEQKALLKLRHHLQHLAA